MNMEEEIQCHTKGFELGMRTAYQKFIEHLWSIGFEDAAKKIFQMTGTELLDFCRDGRDIPVLPTYPAYYWKENGHYFVQFIDVPLQEDGVSFGETIEQAQHDLGKYMKSVQHYPNPTEDAPEEDGNKRILYLQPTDYC